MKGRRLPRTLRGRKPRVLLSGAVMSLLAYMTLAVLVAEQHFKVVDYGTRIWVHMLKHEFLSLPMELVSHLGDHVGLVALIVAGTLILWRANRRWASILPLVMAGTWALQYVTKWLAGRARPDQTPWGFPSGHALSVMVFFGLVIYLLVTASGKRRRWRVLAILVCVSTIMLVAFSRLYLDRHWLSDVVAGLTIGTAYLLLVIWMVEVVWTTSALDEMFRAPGETSLAEPPSSTDPRSAGGDPATQRSA